MDIPLNTEDTCGFLKAADAIAYSGGGTDIALALQSSATEIAANGKHNQTLICKYNFFFMNA